MSGEDFLATMASASARRARALTDTTNDDELMARAMAEPAPPGLSLQSGGFDIIAEIKLRSPAAGQLAAAGEDLQARAALYAGAGACAVSVLTEPERFGGSEADLAGVALALASADVPAMAKDFLVEPCQIAAARIATVVSSNALARDQFVGPIAVEIGECQAVSLREALVD